MKVINKVKQSVMFYGGNEKRFDTEMKKKSFKERFLGVKYRCVKDFCDALFSFSEISDMSYNQIILDFILITKKELKNKFHSTESSCVAVCGEACDFKWKKRELKKILDGWSSKNCDAITLCSILAPHFAMSFKDRDLNLLYFRTKGEYANLKSVTKGV